MYLTVNVVCTTLRDRVNGITALIAINICLSVCSPAHFYTFFIFCNIILTYCIQLILSVLGCISAAQYRRGSEMVDSSSSSPIVSVVQSQYVVPGYQPQTPPAYPIAYLSYPPSNPYPPPGVYTTAPPPDYVISPPRSYGTPGNV